MYIVRDICTKCVSAFYFQDHHSLVSLTSFKTFEDGCAGTQALDYGLDKSTGGMQTQIPRTSGDTLVLSVHETDNSADSGSFLSRLLLHLYIHIKKNEIHPILQKKKLLLWHVTNSYSWDFSEEISVGFGCLIALNSFGNPSPLGECRKCLPWGNFPFHFAPLSQASQDTASWANKNWHFQPPLLAKGPVSLPPSSIGARWLWKNSQDHTAARVSSMLHRLRFLLSSLWNIWVCLAVGRVPKALVRLQLLSTL